MEWENVYNYKEEKDEEGDGVSKIDYSKWVYLESIVFLAMDFHVIHIEWFSSIRYMVHLISSGAP